MRVVGLDIGGANLKAADVEGVALTRPFAVWKAPQNLAAEISRLLASFATPDAIALTMTAELADCYRTKREGVAAVINAVEQAAGPIPVHVWQTNGRFVTPNEARESYTLVAAANWHALATFVGRLAPDGSVALNRHRHDDDRSDSSNGRRSDTRRTHGSRAAPIGRVGLHGRETHAGLCRRQSRPLPGLRLSHRGRTLRDHARRLPGPRRSSRGPRRYGNCRRPSRDTSRGPTSPGPLPVLRRDGIRRPRHAKGSPRDRHCPALPNRSRLGSRSRRSRASARTPPALGGRDISRRANRC